MGLFSSSKSTQDTSASQVTFGAFSIAPAPEESSSIKWPVVVGGVVAVAALVYLLTARRRS